jgi:peptide/nickel transport system permease protein
MARYIVRRIIWGILMLILVSALTFMIFYLLPGADPAVLRAGRDASPHEVAYIRKELGLSAPIYTQFWNYLKAIVLHGNFGYSYYSQQSVLSLIKDRFPATLSLTVGAVLLWCIVGIPVGIISGVMRARPLEPKSRNRMAGVLVVAALIPIMLLFVSKPWAEVIGIFWVLSAIVVGVTLLTKTGTFIERTTMGGALAFVSMPTFWLGFIVLLLFANDIGKFKILPGSSSYVGLTVSPSQWFTSLILPWFVLAATQAAIYSRLMRGNLLEVLGEDYIRTARAKGLPERTVIWKHGVRSAITPVVTVIGIDIAALLGGAVLTETVFGIPGIGLLNYNAITDSDLPIVQGTVLLAAMFIIVLNIIVDISYAWLDPRVTYT